MWREWPHFVECSHLCLCAHDNHGGRHRSLQTKRGRTLNFSFRCSSQKSVLSFPDTYQPQIKRLLSTTHQDDSGFDTLLQPSARHGTQCPHHKLPSLSEHRSLGHSQAAANENAPSDHIRVECFRTWLAIPSPRTAESRRCAPTHT